MEQPKENLYDLLSGFYTLLWAQLDSLFDEHRWVRMPTNESTVARTPAAILEGLSELQQKGHTLPVSLVEMGAEVDKIEWLVGEWKKLQDRLKPEPTNEGLLNQASDLRREIQDKRALFEERALAFASLLVASTQN